MSSTGPDGRPGTPNDGARPSPVTRATARAGRAVAERIDDLFSAGGAGFRDLAVAHAASTAGDTLVAIALAGTLFFSVPSSEARANVALYLVLTAAPFAVIGPALGRILDRYPTAYRASLVVSALLRVVLAIILAIRQDPLWLFPTAFALLVLSRSHGISRNALTPVALDVPLALVAANAKLAQIGVLAGAVVAPVGALTSWLGGATFTMIVAAVAYVVATVAGRRVPHPATAEEVRTARRRRGRRVHIPQTVRLAQLATAVVRLLNGFLVLLLAFAFRDLNAPLMDFGAVLGAAGGGFWLASIVSPHLERRLREEPMVVAALAVEAAAAFVAGQWFGLPAAAFLAAAAGFAWGTAKLAFDGLLQTALPAGKRGAAFTRSETLFQLSWVLGAVLPTGVPIPTAVGLVIAGLAALAAQVVYVSQLLLPLRRPGPDIVTDPPPDEAEPHPAPWSDRLRSHR